MVRNGDGMGWIMRLAAILLVLTIGTLGPAARRAEAVILYGDFGTAASGRNLDAPTGIFASSGWDYSGRWGLDNPNGIVGGGTAIAPNLFLTAAHLGGSVGQRFEYQGQMFTTVASYSDPGGSDLKIWKVSGSFSQYAQIYTKTDEVLKTMAVYGAGSSRGAAVVGPNGNQGYRWGVGDSRLSWGTNQVNSVQAFSGIEYLAFTFQATPPPGTPTSSTLSVGDSGGGLFVQDSADGLWKLAGVNYAVDGNYSVDGTNFFGAAMYDQRGFYVGSAGTGNNIFVTNVGPPEPQLAYSTRVSSHAAFIQNTIALAAVPEPSSWVLMGLGAAAVLALKRRGRGKD